jgi:hypothetical protein
MALTNTFYVTYEQDKYEMKVWDKFMNNVIYTIPTTRYRNHSFIYDADRQLLWIEGSSYSQIFRYALTDIGYTLEATISVPTYGGSESLTLDEATGTVYHVGQGTTSNVVSKIPFNAVATASTLTITSPAMNNHASYKSILFVPSTQKVVVWGGIYNTTTDYPLEAFVELDADLTVQTKVGSLRNYDGYYYRCLRNGISHINYYNRVASSIVYNNVTGKILIGADADGLSSYTSNRIVEVDPTTYDMKFHGIEQYTDKKAVDLPCELFVGKHSGTVYYFIGTKCYKFTPSFTLIKEFTVIGSGAGYISFNEVTEEFYVSDVANNAVHVYTSNGDLIKTKAGFVSDVYCQIPVIGASDTVSNYIEPARIVNPNDANTFTDTTPTLVFKVGSNPVAWTQQFRVVADTDETTLSLGGATDVYARNFDSWTLGTNYVDAAWEYSSDHDETNEADPLNGTWTALGSGEGLRSGGVHGTNGVDGNQGDIYVRMTIPAGSALTGAETNTPWYFKVYSYSKA